MGIRLLNTFIRKIMGSNVLPTHMSKLSGQKIVVDISIYLYRFLGEGRLIENIYLMCSILRHYNVHPLFVFDGKAPLAKKGLLEERRAARGRAKEHYKRYKDLLLQTTDNSERKNITRQMAILRKQTVVVKAHHIQTIQDLLDAYGMKYIVATGEADSVCAALVRKNMAYACLSEDTDLFVYGCPRVLKYFSLANHTAMIYRLSEIRDVLSIEMDDFRTLCVLSGTDYNAGDANIFHFYSLFERYKEEGATDFLLWLGIIQKLPGDYTRIQEISDMYNIDDEKLLSKEKYRYIQNGSINRPVLQQILESDGFIFPHLL